MEAHSVMEKLIFYLCNEQSTALIELLDGIDESDEEDDYYSHKWIFDVFGDMDIITFLYSDIYLDSDHPYHFSHWNDQQFFIE